MKKIILAFLIFLGPSSIYGQCDYFENFSDGSDWTTVGTLVSISNGQFNYDNLCADASQRRMYKALDSPITSDQCWELNMVFNPMEVGTLSGNPFTGHLIFSLTENTNEPLSDCPDIPCTGDPISTQDALTISYSALKPTDGDLHFKIITTYDQVWKISDLLIYNTLNENVYLELIKGCESYELTIYSDAAHTNQIGNTTITLEASPHENFNFIQHGNTAMGQIERELTGYLDDVCINFNICQTVEEYITYQGCFGDDVQVLVNGTIYDELNPDGQEILTSAIGCDSIIYIDLNFEEIYFEYFNHTGCIGDGYEIVINGIPYNENNPIGIEFINSTIGCDSIFNIELNFEEFSTSTISHIGCQDDGYEINLNGNLYNEQNPAGSEFVETLFCDTLYEIDLIFHDTFQTLINYSGCSDDNYFIEVNNRIYNFANPRGIEYMVTAQGCDSIVTIDLEYDKNANRCEFYLPNIISKKDNSFNSIFSVFSNPECVYEILEFKIFDRWGNMVFNNLNNPNWNGTFNNQYIQSGVYAYIIDINEECEIIRKTGTITVIN